MAMAAIPMTIIGLTNSIQPRQFSVSTIDTAKKDSVKFSTFKDLPLKAERSIQFNTQEGT